MSSAVYKPLNDTDTEEELKNVPGIVNLENLILLTSRDVWKQFRRETAVGKLLCNNYKWPHSNVLSTHSLKFIVSSVILTQKESLFQKCKICTCVGEIPPCFWTATTSQFDLLIEVFMWFQIYDQTFSRLENKLLGLFLLRVKK